MGEVYVLLNKAFLLCMNAGNVVIACGEITTETEIKRNILPRVIL